MQGEGITDGEIEALERANPDGISSDAVVSFLDARGMKFSEATLRKYVQLGLLPHSVRVGRKGRNKGSLGMYPSSIVRKIVQIKRLLGENKTIDEIRQEFFLLRGEIEELEQKLRSLFEGIGSALDGRRDDETTAEYLRRDLRDARATAGDLVEKLKALETRLSTRTRLDRAVV
jgi:hypothetical protein